MIRAEGERRRWEDIGRILEAIKTLGDETHPTVMEILRCLHSRFPQTLDQHLHRFRPLRPNEITQMAESPYCTIASHSHTHRILTRCPSRELQNELLLSRNRLEELTHCPVVDLAYPNGDYDDAVLRAASSAGYRRGYTTPPNALVRSLCPMTIPRIGVDGVGPSWLIKYRLARALTAQRIRSLRGTS
jgi:peptidoglycan/xylan/chitin deacetylase (PgdA/CDA1 family)